VDELAFDQVDDPWVANAFIQLRVFIQRRDPEPVASIRLAHQDRNSNSADLSSARSVTRYTLAMPPRPSRGPSS
jgi:hypothetical protein